MLALCLLVYKCLLNEKRLSGVFLPVLRPLPPRVTGFSLVAAGRTKGLETRARLPMPGSAPQLSGCSMESSFLPYLMAVMWMSFLLLLSVWLRAKVTFLQKYLVPAGIIAGTLGFALINLGWIGYPSPEGWVPLKVGDFGMISFHLFSFGFGIIGLGCFSTHTKGRSMTLIKGALWIDLLFWLFYGLQATVGYGITELYAKITGSDLTAATGFLAGFGFAFGPVRPFPWACRGKTTMACRTAFPWGWPTRRRGSWSPTSWACPSPTGGCARAMRPTARRSFPPIS